MSDTPRPKAPGFPFDQWQRAAVELRASPTASNELIAVRANCDVRVVLAVRTSPLWHALAASGARGLHDRGR